MRVFSASLALFLLSISTTAFAEANPVKKWTMLVFLNGNNNLDYYGYKDLNEMEKVGSTADINVVVQWASMRRRTVQRVLVQKDDKPNDVTSPVIQDMGTVDMGDSKNLVEFVRWGVENYPAEKYFIDVWDHGSGWHYMNRKGGRGEKDFDISPSDISFDEISGHHITTQQLGVAMQDASKIIGHKIDLYGSDACLMGMAEVASEMADSVQIFAGSEEVEPGDGWDYAGFLSSWTVNPAAGPAEVGKMLAESYLRSYSGGSQGVRNVTFSILDIEKLAAFNLAVRELGINLMTLDSKDQANVVRAISYSLNFAFADYVDFSDFLRLLEVERVQGLSQELLTEIRTALNDLVLTKVSTAYYSRAGGVAMWLPGTKRQFASYEERYRQLRFQSDTAWGDVLAYVLQGT